jgi:hypothetical protein
LNCVLPVQLSGSRTSLMAERSSGDGESKADSAVSEDSAAKPATLARKPRRRRKKTLTKKVKPKKVDRRVENGEGARTRMSRSFPASTFEEAFVLADAIQKFAPGQEKVRKLTLFDKLGKSPDSGPSRQLITNSSRYGLTKGGYQADFIELTPDGSLATGDDVAPALKLQARFKLAIKEIEPFNFLYERCKDKKMPSKEFLVDAIREAHIEEDCILNASIPLSSMPSFWGCFAQ